jgi:hypothetical protein
MLLMWPREKACRNVRQRAREAVRSVPSNGQVGMVIPKAEPDPQWVVYLFPGRQQQPDIP